MITIPNISCYKAASIHLIFSALIAVAVFTIMLSLWYPPPLFSAMGGMELILLIVGVDIGLGPLITLIIFNPKKKKLVFDLTVIACLQFSALCYGIYSMQAGRPVFIVFVENRFAVISAADLDNESLAQARREFNRLPLTGPKLVAVEMPTDKKEIEDIMFAGLQGLGAQNLPKYYRSYDDHALQALASARSLDKLKNLTADNEAKLQKAIEKSGRSRESLRFLPVVTAHAMLTALLDARTGQVVELLGVNPFPI